MGQTYSKGRPLGDILSTKLMNTIWEYVCLKIVYQQNPLDDHNFPYENSHYWGYTILNHPFFGGEIVPRAQLEIRLGNGGSLSFRAFPLTRRHL